MPTRCAAWRATASITGRCGYGARRRSWSAALVCGLLVDIIAARQLIWVIAAVAGLGAVVSLGLMPLERPRTAATAVHGRHGLAARSRFCRHHPGVGADPGQPCRLLHVCFNQLAGFRSRGADDRRALGARRTGRDRGVRVVAALYARGNDAGGDGGGLGRRALVDLRAGALTSRCSRWFSSRTV